MNEGPQDHRSAFMEAFVGGFRESAGFGQKLVTFLVWAAVILAVIWIALQLLPGATTSTPKVVPPTPTRQAPVADITISLAAIGLADSGVVPLTSVATASELNDPNEHTYLVLIVLIGAALLLVLIVSWLRSRRSHPNAQA